MSFKVVIRGSLSCEDGEHIMLAYICMAMIIHPHDHVFILVFM